MTLVLPFLDELSLQTRPKLHKAFKLPIACCKINVVFKNYRNPLNVLCFKDCLTYDVVSRTNCKVQFDGYNGPFYGETDWHFKVKYGQRISISPLTFNKVKPIVKSSV